MSCPIGRAIGTTNEGRIVTPAESSRHSVVAHQGDDIRLICPVRQTVESMTWKCRLSSLSSQAETTVRMQCRVRHMCSLVQSRKHQHPKGRQGGALHIEPIQSKKKIGGTAARRCMYNLPSQENNRGTLRGTKFHTPSPQRRPTPVSIRSRQTFQSKI